MESVGFESNDNLWQINPKEVVFSLLFFSQIR